MLDADFSTDRFVIDAVDISERSLAQARRGVYGKNSFRGSELAFRDRYFEPVADGHRVNDAVRRAVRFQHGNVLADDFLAGAEPYDAIFCRNLLIYFDDATQDRTIATLRRMLADNGLLFVGPAESSTLLDHDLVSAKVPLAFAFRKAPPRAAPQPCAAAARRAGTAARARGAEGREAPRAQRTRRASQRAREAGAPAAAPAPGPRIASTRRSRSRIRAASPKPRRSARSRCACTARRRPRSI